MHQYERLYCTVVTPFQDNYEIDEPAFRHFLQYFMQPKFRDAGGAIIVNPEAGELGLLNREEKRRLVEIAMEECGDKVPVFAGVAGLRTEETVLVAKDAKEVGATGLFLCPPMGAGDVTRSWNAEKYPEVWLDQATEQVRAADLPVIVHPTAGSTGVLPLNPTLQMCQAIPNIIAWKMTYRYEDFRAMVTGLRSLPRRVAIFGASGNRFHEYLATDSFDGTATGSFCYAMEAMIDHINAWRSNDIIRSKAIWFNGLAQLQEYVYADRRHHVRYKIATWLRGLLPSPFMRPPMPRPRKEEVLTLIPLLKNIGVSVIEQTQIDGVLRRLRV